MDEITTLSPGQIHACPMRDRSVTVHVVSNLNKLAQEVKDASEQHFNVVAFICNYMVL